MDSTKKIPSPLVSLLPIVLLAGMLFATIHTFGSDALGGGSQISLLVTTACCAFIGMTFYRIPWKDFERAITNNIAGVSSALLILLLNRWFKTNVALFASILAVLSASFLYLAGSGTPLIMLVFWPTLLLWLGSKIQGVVKPKPLYCFLFAFALLGAIFTPHLIYLAEIAALTCGAVDALAVVNFDGLIVVETSVLCYAQRDIGLERHKLAAVALKGQDLPAAQKIAVVEIEGVLLEPAHTVEGVARRLVDLSELEVSPLVLGEPRGVDQHLSSSSRSPASTRL